MKKQKRITLNLNSETLRTLIDLGAVRGGGMCSTTAFTGRCETTSTTCTKPP